MAEFWESSFQEKQAMWGFEPADAAISALDLFVRNGFHKILIPGFGYGRNAGIFINQGFTVAGIEISETAIGIAKKHYGNQVKIFHGPVSAMPFDEALYDGIFCYALIHLLNAKEREKLIRDCYNQLRPGGIMIFVAISTSDAAYGQGKKISDNQFLTRHGVNLYFYDSEAIQHEFGNYGLVEANEIAEPVREVNNKPSMKFWQVICKREETK